MLYKIKKFNISVNFNFPGEYTGSEYIYDMELRKMFMFNYETKHENISASCIKAQENIELERYVQANLKNFTKIKGITLYSKKQDDKFFTLIQLPHDKVIQVYFVRKKMLYCFSGTIPFTAKVTDLMTFNTLTKMLSVISSIKDINKNIDF